MMRQSTFGTQIKSRKLSQYRIKVIQVITDSSYNLNSSFSDYHYYCRQTLSMMTDDESVPC